MEHNKWWLPADISTHGAGIDQLINWLHIFMVVLFVGWAIYLVYVLIRFREKANPQSDLTAHHFSLPKYIEIGVVVFEVVLLAFFSTPVWFKYKNDFPAEKDAVVVHITAEQFMWHIVYPGKDGIFGRTDIKLMDGTNPVGLDREDPNGKDDILSTNLFNIPVNKPVIVHLKSKDVIHSFFLPEARVKQDAIPGQEIPIWFETVKTGEFEIACAQLCGLGHYRMRGAFNVMSPEAYATWLEEEHKALTEG